jgi:hypothetical protein
VKKHYSLLVIICCILFSACSTDLDVTGDYKETMIVYGLLDQTQPKQYIRVNKAFLGKGNALIFAKEKDSAQFVNALDVRLKRLSDGKEYILQPDKTILKQDGIFYSGDQTNAIYSFTSTGSDALNAASKYALTVTNTTTGTKATATTSLISNFEITLPSTTTNSSSFSFTPKNEGSRFYVDWVSTKTAKMYQLIVRLNYKDYISVNGVKDSVVKQLDWPLPVHTTSGVDGEKMTNDFSRTEYLQYIGNNMKNYPELEYRKAINMHLIIVAGGEELTTFIEVNKPSSSVVQDKPIYTNIQNGYGVFSSRYYKPPFLLTLWGNNPAKELDSLTCGRFTRTLKFLSSDGTVPPCF